MVRISIAKSTVSLEFIGRRNHFGIRLALEPKNGAILHGKEGVIFLTDQASPTRGSIGILKKASEGKTISLLGAKKQIKEKLENWGMMPEWVVSGAGLVEFSILTDEKVAQKARKKKWRKADTINSQRTSNWREI